MRVYTIGHSTRTLQELVSLLQAHAVDALVDIRAHPGSRKFPHFRRESLAAAFADGRPFIYRHIRELGGRRRSKQESNTNAAWRSASFRAYADHLASEEFRRGLDELLELARGHTVAVMCAEAVPWRCHRMVLSDALTARGVDVRHIIGPGEAQPHRLTPFAQVHRGKVTYPAPADRSAALGSDGRT